MRNQSLGFILTLWTHLDYKRKIQFLFLLILIILSSIFEMLSIGAVFPFLLVLSTPEVLFEYDALKSIFIFLGYDSASETLFITTIFFISATLLAAIFRITLLYYLNFLSYITCADIGVIAVNKTLHQPYSTHTKRNSSELINSVVVKVNTVLQGVILPAMTIISSFFTAFGILIVISIVSFEISLTALLILGFIYIIFVQITKKRVSKNSKAIAIKSTRVVKILQESLGGIRDIILDNAQSLHSKIYKDAETNYRLSQASNAFIGASPRYIIEPIGIIVIALIAYSYSMRNASSGIESIIPILGALALGLQRLLPVLQQAYASIVSIRGAHHSFSDVIYLLDQEIEYEADSIDMKKNLLFNNSITLKNVSYSYDIEGPEVLSGINLKIVKGSCVGVIGETGSGKSTLIDIIMGLLMPSKGELLVDSETIKLNNLNLWRSHISHVPQSIFLTDSSIAENIALNIPKENIDLKLLAQVVKQAQLSNLINSWPDRYETIVGERGIRLSGGQRQRIGIARALYKQSSVIILDEATSALDSRTESKVIKEVFLLNYRPTVIIIAHRHSTLENCDHIIEVKDASLNNVGSYENLNNT